MIRLDLGAGAVSPAGFVPMGKDHGSEIYPLEMPDATADEIRASHVLEHFVMSAVPQVLAEWFRVLKPGGRIAIAVPDFEKIAKNYVEGVPQNTQGYVMGGHIDAHDQHHTIFDQASLRMALAKAGFVLIRPWVSELPDDAAALPISLNLEARKPHVSTLKLHAAMTVPRLGFNDMWSCAAQVFPTFNIGFNKTTGAFWEHCMTKALDNALAEQPDYVIACDYDSVFNHSHVARLVELAMVNPQADAIAPIQASRHQARPLFALDPEAGASTEKGVTDVAREDFLCDLKPVPTAHFGLTLIKASALREQSRPWFLATPNEDGEWAAGKTDADIHFWRQWRAAGRTLFLAPRISIGHLELMVRWTGDDFNPIWQSTTEWEETRRAPAGSWTGFN